MAEGQACMLPLPDPATFLGRLEELCRTSNPKPKMILISFPHNPTTTCVDLDFFRDIVALAREHGTMIVHDFAYADLGFDGYTPPSILQMEGASEVAVEIFSMSKSFNMAGWRVGYCVGNAKMIAALARIKSYLDYGVFQPIQIASILALRECEQDTLKIRATYQKRRDVLVEGLIAPVGRWRARAGRCSCGLRCRSGTAVWARWNFRSCCSIRRSSRFPRAPGSGRWAKATSVSPWSRTNSGSGRPRGTSSGGCRAIRSSIESVWLRWRMRRRRRSWISGKFGSRISTRS
jgi:hypothetical protein